MKGANRNRNMQTILTRVETSNLEFLKSIKLIVVYVYVSDLNG